jgi:hypothetical protein
VDVRASGAKRLGDMRERLDSSAILKLVVLEPESQALRRYLQGEPARASCVLARVEVLRAVARHGATVLGSASLLGLTVAAPR